MFKLDFPNVRCEADFIRAYVHSLAALRRDIAAYIAAHGFDEEKYNALFAERMGDLYIGLTKARISLKAAEALAFLYHKEMSEMGVTTFGQPVKNHALIATEYAKVRHVVDRAMSE